MAWAVCVSRAKKWKTELVGTGAIIVFLLFVKFFKKKLKTNTFQPSSEY